MAEAHAEMTSPPVRRGKPLDLGLNIGLAILALAILGLAAWFGWSVYQNNQRNEMTNASSRIVLGLREQVKQYPADATLRVRLGEALASGRNFNEAVKQFNAALKIDPKHQGAYLDLGMVAMLNDKDAEAERYFNKVIELTEKDQYSAVNNRRELALYNLGLLKLEQERFDEAAGYFKGALRIRKDASDTYVNLAKALKGLEDNEGAIANLEIALTFDPGYAEAHYMIGQLYQQKKDMVNASYHLAKAAEKAPNAEPPAEALAAFGTSQEWLAKAEKALAAGDPDTALDDALVARNLDQENLAAVLFHGKLLVAQKNLKSALKVYQQALEIDPDNAEAKAKVAELKKATAKKKSK